MTSHEVPERYNKIELEPDKISVARDVNIVQSRPTIARTCRSAGLIAAARCTGLSALWWTVGEGPRFTLALVA